MIETNGVGEENARKQLNDSNNKIIKKCWWWWGGIVTNPQRKTFNNNVQSLPNLKEIIKKKKKNKNTRIEMALRAANMK